MLAPAQTDNSASLAHLDLEQEITKLKREMNAVILAHYYQESEIQDLADFVGDSLQLSQQAAATKADVIVFAGVLFMAETAKILNPAKLVLLPDLKAGCSLADGCPAPLFKAFRERYPDHLVISYINCSAEVKALSDIICTSSNAEKIIRQIPPEQPIVFAPDQHLGRNTAFAMGIPLDQCVVWDPFMIMGGVTPDRLRRARVILWKGHCSVHQRFLPEHVDKVRERYPDIQVIVHPECRFEVCQKADGVGSTERLIKIIKDAPRGTKFAVGTEIHLVNRMGKEFAEEDKMVITLDDSGCLCTTMFRISPQHLCWALENLVEGNVVNRIQVPEDVKHWAHVALDRMLEIH